MVELHLEDSLKKLDDSGPIFIMGCPRSGTTFLLNCISQLPEVEAFSGTLIPPQLMHLLGKGSLSGENTEHVLWAIRYSLWRSFVEQYNSRESRLLRLGKALRGRLAWSKVLSSHKRPIKDYLLLYKEPFIAFGAFSLAQHFPNSKFIHIIRDGRDCADSLDRSYPNTLSDQVLQDALLWRQKGWEIGMARRWKQWYIPWWVREGGEEDFTEASRFGRCVWMWKEMVERGRLLGQSISHDRYLEIRYEDLCREPAGIGKDILLSLDTRPNGQYWQHLAQAKTSSIGIHRRRPVKDIKEAHRIGLPLLEVLGYA